MDDMIANFLVSLSANFATDMVKFVKATLLPHQMTNLSTWFCVWQPTEQEVEDIKNKENLRRMFSVMFEKVQNEIFDEKLQKWGYIASNVVMGRHSDFAEEKRFIKLFVELDMDDIEYLLKLKSKGGLKMTELYPQGFPAKKDTESERNACLLVNAVGNGLAIGTATVSEKKLTSRARIPAKML